MKLMEILDALDRHENEKFQFSNKHKDATTNTKHLTK